MLYVPVAIALIVSVFMACAFGSSRVPLHTVVSVLENQLLGTQSTDITASDIYIVWNLRFPRAVLAFAVGGGLAVAGAAMQSITKNVMADPYVLGISSGALSFERKTVIPVIPPLRVTVKSAVFPVSFTLERTK